MVELWRKTSDSDSPLIFMADNGDIGIIADGYAVVLPVERWHELGLHANHIAIFYEVEW